MIRSSDKKIVGVAFDDKYLFPFLLLAFTISKNSKSLPEIYVANVNGTLSKESQSILESFSSLLGMQIRVLDCSIPNFLAVDDRISIAAYGRLWLADSLKADFVYLDVDTLVLPGWEMIFDFVDRLEENQTMLLAAMPAFGDDTPPWEIANEDKTQYRFHSGVLVINYQNWSKHFMNNENPTWVEIASRQDILGFTSHDQSVLQFAAQGNYLRIPENLVTFANANHLNGKILTCGTWIKPWTIRKKDYRRYLSASLMQKDFLRVLGTMKELELFAGVEEELFRFLNQYTDLGGAIKLVKEQSEIELDKLSKIFFYLSKNLFNSMVHFRQLINFNKIKSIL